MLEREYYNVLDPLNRRGQRVTREAFTDDDLDPANIITWDPVILV